MKKILYAVFALMIATSLMAAKRPQWNKTSSNKTYQVYAGTVAIVASDGLNVFASSATFTPTIKLYGDTGEVEAMLLDADTVTVDTITSVQVNVTSITASGEITTGYGFFHRRGDKSGKDWGQETLTMNNNWIDLNVSTIVPTGAKAVVLAVLLYDDIIDNGIYFRCNGDSNSIEALSVTSPVINHQISGQIIVPCDTDRIIEYRIPTALSRLDITVIGWWK